MSSLVAQLMIAYPFRKHHIACISSKYYRKGTDKNLATVCIKGEGKKYLDAMTRVLTEDLKKDCDNSSSSSSEEDSLNLKILNLENDLMTECDEIAVLIVKSRNNETLTESEKLKYHAIFNTDQKLLDTQIDWIFQHLHMQFWRAFQASFTKLYHMLLLLKYDKDDYVVEKRATLLIDLTGSSGNESERFFLNYYFVV
jgi:hypothetical protein